MQHGLKGKTYADTFDLESIQFYLDCKDARIDASLRVSVGLEPPPPEPAAGGLSPLLRRRPAALIGPGLGLAMPPCPDGAAHGRLGLRSAARHRRCPRRPHRPGPGTGNAASPGRGRTQVTRTGARVAPGPTARLPHRLGPGTGTAARPGRCKTQVTRIAVGDCERAADNAGVGDPPSSPARAGGWHCRPARPVQDACDSDRGRRLRARRPHQSGPGPGPGTATPPGRCSGQWLACRRQTRTRSGEAGPHGRHLTPTANRRVSQRNLAALQSTGSPANFGGRRSTCKGHAPTYSLYTARGHSA